MNNTTSPEIGELRVYYTSEVHDAEGGYEGNNGVFYHHVKSPQEAQDVIIMLGKFDTFLRRKNRIYGSRNFGLEILASYSPEAGACWDEWVSKDGELITEAIL